MANTPEIPVVLLAQIDLSTVVTSQTYNNVNSTLHGIAPYYIDLTINMPGAQFHYDDTTTTPFQYDFNNLEVGMWIAEQTGKAWLITAVEIVSDNQANITIKDVNLFNVLSDPTFSGGYGSLPSSQDASIIFHLSEDAVPMIPSIYLDYSNDLGGSSYWVATDVMTRFQYRNLLKSHYNNSDSPNPTYSSYQVGQMVYLDSNGVFKILDASNSAEVKKRFGVITSVNVPEDGDLGVRPWGKIVGDLDLSSFTVGDALYYDGTAPAPYLTATEPASSAIPMYIKISDTTGMYITDMVGGGGDQIYISQVPDGTPTPEDVGGIDQGTLPENIGDGTYTLSEVIDQLLWPAICPTPPSGQPNISLSDNVGPLELIGDTINISFTTGATLGQFSNSTTYAGDVTGATLTGAGSTNETLITTPPTGIADYTLNNYVVASGVQSWTLSGTFDQGPIPNDNLGNPCPDIQYLGGSDSASVNLEGVYPAFRGTSASYSAGAVASTWDSTSITDLIATGNWETLIDLPQNPNGNSNLISTVNDNLSDGSGYFSFASGSTQSEGFPVQQAFTEGTGATPPRHRFAVPNNITVDSIYGYNSFSDSWYLVSSWSQYSVTLTINGSTVNYTIYERAGTDAGPTKFRVTFS